MMTPVLLTKRALFPNFHMENAKLYLHEENLDRSIYELGTSIFEIERIKVKVDPKSRVMIELALKDLRDVYTRMKNNDVNMGLLDRACVEMLLALSFAQVKSAEYFVGQKQLEKSRKSLKNGMYHIKRALRISEGTYKDNEINVYTEMNEIVSNRKLSEKEINKKLKFILKEIQELDFFQSR